MARQARAAPALAERCPSSTRSAGCRAVARPTPRPTPDDDAGALRRRHRQPGADPAVLGHARRQGHRAGRLRRLPRRARDLPGPVGAASRPAARAGRVRGAGRDRGPAAAADLAGPAPDRGPARGGRRLRLLPVLSRGRRPGRAATTTATAGAGAGFTFPRQRRDRRLCLADFFRPRGRRARLDVVAFQRRHDGRRGLARRPRSCSPATPTATTSSCTACRCS